MTDHPDTPRVKLLRTAIDGYLGADRALDALLAENQRLETENAIHEQNFATQAEVYEFLKAENQRLREDKAWALQLLSVLLNDFEWLLEQHPEHDGKYALDRIEQAREALAGDGE